MDIKNKKIVIFSVISLVFVLLNLLVSGVLNVVPYYLTRPLFLGFMMFMYCAIVQKPDKLLLSCQSFTVIAEFLQYYNKDFFFLAIFFFVIGMLFLIRAVFVFVPKIKTTYFLFYLFLYLLLLGVLFLYVMDKNANKILLLGYGIVFVVLASLIFVNFLLNMTKANFVLLLGILVASISNSIVSINISNILEDKPVLIITSLTTFLTHYLINLGFIYKEDESLLWLKTQ